MCWRRSRVGFEVACSRPRGCDGAVCVSLCLLAGLVWRAALCAHACKPVSAPPLRRAAALRLHLYLKCRGVRSPRHATGRRALGEYGPGTHAADGRGNSSVVAHWVTHKAAGLSGDPPIVRPWHNTRIQQLCVLMLTIISKYCNTARGLLATLNKRLLPRTPPPGKSASVQLRRERGRCTNMSPIMINLINSPFDAECRCPVQVIIILWVFEIFVT